MKRKYLRLFYVLALIVLMLNSLACTGNGNLQGTQSGIDKKEWMKFLPDTLPVCKISIPGTHDSGTVKGGPMLQTQVVGIPEQLQQGIRAFDIRLEKKDNKLGVFHSYAFQDTYWEDDL